MGSRQVVVSESSGAEQPSGETTAGHGEMSPREGVAQWLRGHVRRRREHIRSQPAVNTVYRVALAVVGGLVLVVGIVLGWLIVFAGLGILATEFHWAHRINTVVTSLYRRWLAWLRRQHWSLTIAVGCLTCGVVVATCWLAGVFGVADAWLGPGWGWARSPLLEP